MFCCFFLLFFFFKQKTSYDLRIIDGVQTCALPISAEVGLHESTISRAISRKYVRTPRGTIPLRAFFASGIGTEGGGEASSIAIQEMIKRLVEAENPRKPLSDARLAENLKAAGVPVARRTVAKYRELLNIPSSHERVRIA